MGRDLLSKLVLSDVRSPRPTTTRGIEDRHEDGLSFRQHVVGVIVP